MHTLPLASARSLDARAVCCHGDGGPLASRAVSHLGLLLWVRGHEGVGGRVRIIHVPMCEWHS